MNNFKNILIIGAHYDDSELGVGGTAAKLTAMGKNVYKITLTNNITKSDNLHINVEFEDSKLESKNACDVLGVKELEFDCVNCCDLIYTKELMQKVEDIIFKYNIDTAFIHFEDDYNQDHVAAHIISKTAARHCKNILSYHSNGYILATPFYPSVFVDISDFVYLKEKALNCYTGDHNRFGKLFEMTLDKNRIWGYGNKTEYCEAFHAIKLNLI